MNTKKKSGGSFSTVLFIIIFFAGLSLLLYPSFSNYWNSMHMTHAIASYVDAVANLDAETYERMWQEALDYNTRLAGRGEQYTLSQAEQADYDELLNVGGSGVMGYIDIPAIEVSLPVYHGTSEGVLQVAVGHLHWTSLPVGGLSSHCVLSGHRGLPSAKLFTDLDQVVEGDTFLLTVLDNVLTYEVDQIRIVEPSDTSDLQIEPGKDYCTLVTCTPYGINTHRLLVRGHRIETTQAAAAAHITADAIQVEEMIVAPIMAIPMLLLLLIVLLAFPQRKRRTDDSESWRI